MSAQLRAQIWIFARLNKNPKYYGGSGDNNCGRIFEPFQFSPRMGNPIVPISDGALAHSDQPDVVDAHARRGIGVHLAIWATS